MRRMESWCGDARYANVSLWHQAAHPSPLLCSLLTLADGNSPRLASPVATAPASLSLPGCHRAESQDGHLSRI